MTITQVFRVSIYNRYARLLSNRYNRWVNFFLSHIYNRYLTWEKFSLHNRKVNIQRARCMREKNCKIDEAKKEKKKLFASPRPCLVYVLYIYAHITLHRARKTSAGLDNIWLLHLPKVSILSQCCVTKNSTKVYINKAHWAKLKRELIFKKERTFRAQT